ncbi:Aste57867_20769 [Aphanomyces stellatus]|uniref:glucan endo-1,3-beta-D-glucosidase n=1 Tax=Aphanomyces stellatus TaxID=120398 RepID=A0A485LFW9_9STRA|nr:hypothetical protein As57867_020701 [Aphanomyces stellatus]VFT97448.1 Aste57867_20769 [Aphanomyces stellatus]
MPPNEQSAENVVTTSTAIVVIAPDVQYEAPADKSPAAWSTKKRSLVALAASLLVVGAVVGAVISTSSHATTTSTSATVSSGNNAVSVCYDSWDSWGPGKMVAQFTRIKERFSTIRTFQTQGAQNHIDVAAQVGLSIYAGVWIQSGNVDADMQAAVNGAKAHPNTVKAILVGNEEIHAGMDVGIVIGRVKQMKQMLQNAGVGHIKVGSVQVDGDWFSGAGDALASVCDVIGANIHPFFSASDVSKSNPIDDLKARWNAIEGKFGGKAVVTEVGWPTSGGPVNGHAPSMDMAKKFLNDVAAWANGGGGGDAPAYFMFADNPTKGPDFEKSFGLANADTTWKFDFSINGGGGPAPSPNNPPAPAPADDQATPGVVFVNPDHDKVLAVASDRGVEFHERWGEGWRNDVASHWTVRGTHLASWEASTQTDVCLDAYEPWNGGRVHVWPCDPNNKNQKWRFDEGSQQLRHVGHDGFCLDMDVPEGGTPHLWECLDGGHESFNLQHVQWWKAY